MNDPIPPRASPGRCAPSVPGPRMQRPRTSRRAAAEPAAMRFRRWRQRGRDAAAELAKSKTGLAGGVILLLVFSVCAMAPVLTRYDPLKIDVTQRLQLPSCEHLLGTDHFGRDVYSRILWGGRRVLVVALLAVSLGLLLGVPLGLFAGYAGGWIDGLAMRFVDALLAFPGILLFLLFMTLAQAYKLEGVARDAILVTALGVAFMPETARLMRGAMLNERGKEYVEAARLMGNSSSYIVLREILPNCVSPLIVHATVYLGIVILALAALSYLGLGTPPPTPDWGGDLRAATDYMEQVPGLAVIPGLAISITVLGFNLLGDGLRDILDPRLAQR